MAATFEQELESLHELEFESELEGLGELETELEMEGVGEFEAETELEMELEGEGELESEISPVRKIYADAMMEHLAHMAAESETEQEAAEHFLPLIGLAAKKLLPMVARAVTPALKRALPRVARAVTRVEPQLTRGITRIARGLHRQPVTRRLLHAVPAIARRTVQTIARQAAHGRPVTPRSAIGALARQARLVLGTRPGRLQALRRSRIMDRQFHRHLGPGVVRPHWWTWYRGGVPAGGPAATAAPVGYMTTPGPGGATAARYVRTAGPGGVCPPCPRCGGQALAAPAYCRCCGQVLR
jgi:hypothetical protein